MARGSKGSGAQSRKTKSASSKPDNDSKLKSELPKGGKRNGKSPKEAIDLDVKRITRGKRKSEKTDKGDNRDHNVEAVKIKSTDNNNDIKQSEHSENDRQVCVKREVNEVDCQKASEKSDVVEFMSSSSDTDSDFEPETKKLTLTPKCNSSAKADFPKSRKKKEKEKNINGCESPDKLNISTSNSKRKSNTGRSRGKSEDQLAISRSKASKGKQGEISKPKKNSKAKGKSDDAEGSGKPDETRKRKRPEKCAPEMPDLSVEKKKKRKKNSKKDSMSTEKEPASVVKMELDNDVKKTDKLIHSNIDQSDVMSVLLHMEGQSMLSNGQNDWTRPSTSGIMVKSDGKGGDSDVIESIDEDDDDESEESEWEEVEDDPSQRSPLKSQIPSEPVEVTLDAPQILKKRKKKQFDWKAYIQRQINRFRKELREDIHKVHLMCLVARGMYLNRVCNDTTLHAITMSIIPAEFIKKQRSSCDNGSVERLMKWFKGCFRIVPDVEETEEDMVVKLIARLDTKSVTSSLEFVMLFIIILRFLGFHARLVMSHQPLSLKASEPKSGKVDSSKSKVKGNPSAEKKKSKSSKSNSNKNTSSKEEKGKKAQTSKGSGKSAKSSKSDKRPKGDSKGEQKTDVKKKALRKRGVKVKPSNYHEDEGSVSSEDDYVPSDESDEEGETGGKTRKRKEKGKKKSKVKKQKSSTSHGDEDDFEEETISFRSPLKKKNSNRKPNKKVLSSDSENGAEESRNGCDQWAEVYLDERWICVDCLHGHMNRPYRIESAASQPVHYVLAYNSDGTVKDVTARYASKWMTDTRKIRVNSDWWDETLDPYRTTNQKLDEKEDNDIKSNLVSRPMPTNIGAFKSHPLYALTRHLLKFEAIYPESAVPLGYIRGEPIYARECVHELHSRENWIKEGRAVRIGEKPYKMVKSRPKWNKPKENPDALDLEVFGLWQTEEYIPPPAVNGKVPRNDYGNIELFKPSMLPAGTVYLQVQGLNKVAKKLNVDCVPAMVGWDSHCGFSHPVLDGFVVCEEHKDILLAAWDEEQEIQKQKEAEKKEKRALNNWKVLIKGLLIKERLKKRFDLEEKDEEIQEVEEKKPVKGQRANDAELAWPRRQQDAKSKKGKGKKSDNKANHFKVETM